MAIVRPFRAIRPREGFESDVVSLPYDVMNRREAFVWASSNPYSFLHISRAEVDLPELEDQYDEAVYEKARENLELFISKGILRQDLEESFYIYRQAYKGNIQTGLVSCVSIDDYENNVIRKHELTRVEKELDRINHFDVCNANTEPVFLTFKDEGEARENVATLMDDYAKSNDAEYEISMDDGVDHSLWVIRDDWLTQRLIEIFKSVPSLYIADGHHRSASAYKVGQKKRSENPGYTGNEEFNFFMAVIYPHDQLRVFDYNRVVKDFNGDDEFDFFRKIEESGFIIEKVGKKPCKPECKHVFGMYLVNGWYMLTAKDEIIPEDIIGGLDVSILQDNLLKPILGIENPREDKRIDFVGGIRGLKELEKRVNDDMIVAFALYPVTIEDLMTVSDKGMIMPPKSTWFEPKIGSGLFLHML